MSTSQSQPRPETEDRKANIVLLGHAGTGKSASGNTILGKYAFKSYLSSVPVTTECQVDQSQLFGTEVRVIDTPDFFHENVEYSVKDVIECKKLCGDGSSVYLLVIQIGRFTEGKRGILKQLEEALGEIRDKMIVLFTHGEDLENMSKDMFIQSDPHLKKIVELCGDRSHVFRNTVKDSQQVVELMTVISRFPGYDQMFPDLPERINKTVTSCCTQS